MRSLLQTLVCTLTLALVALSPAAAAPTQAEWTVLAKQSARCAGAYKAMADVMSDNVEQHKKLSDLRRVFEMIATRSSDDHGIDGNMLIGEHAAAQQAMMDAVMSENTDFIAEVSRTCRSLIGIAQGMGLQAKP